MGRQSQTLKLRLFRKYVASMGIEIATDSRNNRILQRYCIKCHKICCTKCDSYDRSARPISIWKLFVFDVDLIDVFEVVLCILCTNRFMCAYCNCNFSMFYYLSFFLNKRNTIYNSVFCVCLATLEICLLEDVPWNAAGIYFLFLFFTFRFFSYFWLLAIMCINVVSLISSFCAGLASVRYTEFICLDLNTT